MIRYTCNKSEPYNNRLPVLAVEDVSYDYMGPEPTTIRANNLKERNDAFSGIPIISQ